MVQKSDPDYVGRQRITRHELKEWARVAERRGSDLQLSPGNEDPEGVAEQVLAWYLEQEPEPRQLLAEPASRPGRLGAWRAAAPSTRSS